MAKSGQKRKKAEKSKTQLKTSMKAAGKADKKKKVKGASGIKLPKGLNEVKPEVKTKVLTLTERAVPRERVELDKPGGKRYRPIQDVLSKLRHHSHFSRSDALKALKEILEECPHAVGAQRAEVLRRLLPLAIDVEDQVRTLFVQVFSLLINILSSSERRGHSELIGAHIGSALSHVSSGVRKDALTAVDVMVEQAPELITSCQEMILPSCVSQLSGASSSRLSSGVTSKDGILKDRLAVLNRINIVLKLCGKIKSSKNKSEDRRTVNVINEEVWMSKNGDSGFLKDLGGRAMVAGCGMSLQELGQGWSDLLSSIFSDDKLKDKSEGGFARQFCQKLAPLLLECWREVMPEETTGSKKKGKKAKGVTKEGAEIMLEVTETMRGLHGMLQNEEDKYWFRDTFLLNNGQNSFACLCLGAMTLTAAFGEGPDRILHKLKLGAAASCINLNQNSDPELTLALLDKLKGVKLAKCPLEEKKLCSDILLKALEGENVAGGVVEAVEALALALYEVSSGTDDDGLDEVMLRLFMDRGLDSCRSWLSDLPARLASGRFGQPHLEAIRHVSRTRDSAAVSLLAESLTTAKDDFFKEDQCDTECAKLALRVLTAFAMSTRCDSAKIAVKHILNRQPKENLPMITLM